MTSLRKAIARYAAWLEGRAQRHEAFAKVLTAVAHRLQHILDDTEDPDQEAQYGYWDGEGVTKIDTLDEAPKGAKLYTRTASYSPWKEIR